MGFALTWSRVGLKLQLRFCLTKFSREQRVRDRGLITRIPTRLPSSTPQGLRANPKVLFSTAAIFVICCGVLRGVSNFSCKPAKADRYQRGKAAKLRSAFSITCRFALRDPGSCC